MNEAAAVRGDQRVGRSGLVRILNRDDLASAVAILSSNPVENVFVAARVRSAGLEPASLGCSMWGFERDGVLRAVCHAGFNLVPVNADPEAVAGFAEFAGRNRMCSSIFGPSTVVLEMWHQLSDRWGSCWSDVREVRPRQPVLAIDTEPAIESNPEVRRVTLEHWDAYFEAAVKMYTEEVGVSPIQGNPAGYRFYVRQLITSGRAFALFDGSRVLFKADLGSVSGTVSQVQGVWVDPAMRGRGLAAPAMAAVVRMARTLTPTVSLYVNDFNTRARRAYQRVGFAPVGEFATILY